MYYQEAIGMCPTEGIFMHIVQRDVIFEIGNIFTQIQQN